MNDQIIIQRGRSHWPRLAAERLFIGKTAEEALLLVPRLFALCGHAQTLAARLALACAQNSTAQASEHELLALQTEASRETMRRWLLDWAGACGEVIATRDIASFARAHTLPDLAHLAQGCLFGEDLDSWRGRGLDGWQQWASHGNTAAARALSRLLQQGAEPCGQLQVLPAAAILASRGDWLEHPYPVWQFSPCEVGALAAKQSTIAPWLQSGHVSAARLLSRLLMLAETLQGALPAASACRHAAGGLARVDTARGPLLHLATIGADKRISHYRVIPPTLWHAHPQGVMAQAANGVSVHEARRRLLLIDPCVAFTLADAEAKETEYA